MTFFEVAKKIKEKDVDLYYFLSSKFDRSGKKHDPEFKKTAFKHLNDALKFIVSLQEDDK